MPAEGAAVKLSLCIPTYNRAKFLSGALSSIAEVRAKSSLSIEVCVSDNASTDATAQVVADAQKLMPIKYRKNPENQGVARNILAAVAMAEGEFSWLLGDDDRLLPNALERLSALFQAAPRADHFFVNSQSEPGGPPFSSWTRSGSLRFLELVDPKISFDFLVGMFLSVFRTRLWRENLDALDQAALHDARVFSSLDNMAPHVKIFAKAFAQSESYLCAEPLTVNLSGAREWAPLYPLVKSVRLVEALEEYRKHGLPFLQYVRCRNAALNTFLPDLANILVHGESKGAAFVKPGRLLLSNFPYPNFYLSPFYYAGRKLRQKWAR